MSKSKVYMGFDGGYRGIVVKIDNHFDQDQPHDEIIDSIKVDRNSNKKRSICKSRYLVHLCFMFYTFIILNFLSMSSLIVY